MMAQKRPYTIDEYIKRTELVELRKKAAAHDAMLEALEKAAVFIKEYPSRDEDEADAINRIGLAIKAEIDAAITIAKKEG